MESKFNGYLRGERWTAMFLICWALLTSGLAALGYGHWHGNLFRALAFTVGLLSTVQAWAGARKLMQANRLQRELRSIVRIAPPSFAAQEIPRLDKRVQMAQQRRLIEQALFIMGMCFTLAGILRFSGRFLLGAGIGLCVQSAVLLLVTLTGQWRDALYRNEVERELGP